MPTVNRWSSAVSCKILETATHSSFRWYKYWQQHFASQYHRWIDVSAWIGVASRFTTHFAQQMARNFRDCFCSVVHAFLHHCTLRYVNVMTGYHSHLVMQARLGTNRYCFRREAKCCIHVFSSSSADFPLYRSLLTFSSNYHFYISALDTAKKYNVCELLIDFMKCNMSGNSWHKHGPAEESLDLIRHVWVHSSRIITPVETNVHTNEEVI